VRNPFDSVKNERETGRDKTRASAPSSARRRDEEMI